MTNRDKRTQTFNNLIRMATEHRLAKEVPIPAEIAAGASYHNIVSVAFHAENFKEKVSEARVRIRKQVIKEDGDDIRKMLGFERCTDATGWRLIGND